MKFIVKGNIINKKNFKLRKCYSFVWLILLRTKFKYNIIISKI